MASYLVSWEIDIDAESPKEAAQKALAIQRDTTSIATNFMCTNLDRKTGTPQRTVVDLYLEDSNESKTN